MDVSAADRLEHDGIELVAVVQDVDAIAGKDRHARRTSDGGEEFIRIHGELVLETYRGGVSIGVTR